MRGGRWCRSKVRARRGPREEATGAYAVSHVVWPTVDMPWGISRINDRRRPNPTYGEVNSNSSFHRTGARKPRARSRVARRVIFETRSPLSGRIRVVESGPERRLMIGGEIQSVYFPDGDWSAAEPEYWARALAPARALRPRPRILLVGLGGGTQVHLLKRYGTPRLITVIERDPIVIGVANEWFGLKSIGALEIRCADAELAIRH